MLKFSVVKVLFSIFTPEFDISKTLKIANLVSDLVGDRLDGEPTILPIPPNSPLVVPRIIMRSSDKLLSLSISPKRTNFEFKIPVESIVDMIDYRSYYSGVANFFSEFQKELNLKIQRLGYATERFNIKEDAFSYIMQLFCNRDQTTVGKPFYQTKRFEIHSLKGYEWDGFQINSWVRIKCLPIKVRGNERNALLVQNDLNTLSIEEDPGANFNTNEVEKYFNNIPIHLDQILDLYFGKDVN